MRFGITMFATDISIGVPELALAAEERGFESLWIPEHTNIPVSRVTPPPTGEDKLPEEYLRSVDPLVTLAAAAMVTSTIRLGTSVLLAAQREPIVTAKALATLQNLSGGRLEVGVGFGWNRDEIEQHGVDFGRRRAVAREHVLAMKTLWTEDQASFHGEFVNLEPTWSWPKPEVPIPVLLGGSGGPKLMEHLVEYADGWLPIGGGGLTEGIPRYHEQLAAAGRNPDSTRVIPIGSRPDPAKIAHFESIGVHECVFRVESAPTAQALATLDAQIEIVESLR